MAPPQPPRLLPLTSSLTNLQLPKTHKSALQCVMVNIFFPMLIYYISLIFTSDLYAIVLATLPPTIETIVQLIRLKYVDPISLLQIVATTFAILVLWVTKEPTILIVKDSFTTMTLGIGLLVSLSWEENLIWHYFREFYGTNDSKRLAISRHWCNKSVQVASKRVCLVWALAMLLEAGIRIILSLVLSVSAMIIVSPLLALSFTALVLLWTRLYLSKLPALEPHKATIYQSI
ncbi:hypothetical protein THRCLA_20648 [Thraustotheca clavata]|uniref:Transmembrane protein n=1 Tax=Thraustotheca clavata TaxID=74557 RepID=A0A1W0A576_9STRA|nr:hypothetical protein THRCLA_20648 [Thraustotheca clavata]